MTCQPPERGSLRCNWWNAGHPGIDGHIAFQQQQHVACFGAVSFPVEKGIGGKAYQPQVGYDSLGIFFFQSKAEQAFGKKLDGLGCQCG